MKSTSVAGALASLAAIAMLQTAGASAQGAGSFWYALDGSTHAPLSRFIAESLGAGRGPAASTGDVSVDEAYAELRKRSTSDLVFVIGSLKSTQRLIALDSGHDTLKRLGLETVNVRIAGHPFHFFHRADQDDRIHKGSTPLRVAFAALAESLSAQDVKRLLEPLLGTRPLEVVRLQSAGVLARGLASDSSSRIDLVGIYDADPSVFLRDFVREYAGVQPRGNAGRLRRARVFVFPTDQAGFEPDHLRLSSGGALGYAFLRYDSRRFYGYEEMTPEDPNGVVLAVTPSTSSTLNDDAPLVMTNLRSVRGAQAFERFARQLSDAYVEALFQVQTYGNRCSGPAAPLFRTFLFNAHVADRANFAKTLGLWSHLTIMSTSPARDRGAYAEQARLLEDALGPELATAIAKPQEIVRRLRSMQPDSNVRLEFSGDVSTIYRRARQALENASKTREAATRARQLDTARSLLLQLVAAGRMPSCHQGGRAMWSAEDFDPFFNLAFADALSRTGGTR